MTPEERSVLMAELAAEQAVAELQRQASLTQLSDIKPGMDQAAYEKACADILAALGGRNQ